MNKIIYICICLFAGSANAIPIGFDFYQGGFDEGATVTGMFTGEDLDSNGHLSSFDGEVSSFMMDFSGNSLVSSFSLGFDDLYGLIYDLGREHSDGILAITEDEKSGYIAAPGLFGVCGIWHDCALVADGQGISTSAQMVMVSPKDIPEPALLALLGIGLAGFSISRKKKNV